MLGVFRSGGASGADMTGTYRRSTYRIGLNTASDNTNYSNLSATNYMEWAFGLRNTGGPSMLSAVYDFFSSYRNRRTNLFYRRILYSIINKFWKYVYVAN